VLVLLCACVCACVCICINVHVTAHTYVSLCECDGLSCVLLYRNAYIGSLQSLTAAGNTTSFPLDIDILRFLDEGEVSNPWLYMHKSFEDCEKVAEELAERKCFLEVCRFLFNIPRYGWH
jgi:hypothetical protein